MRNSVFNVLALTMMVVLTTSGQASASTLASTPEALGAWQGSHNFNVPAVLDATVEYAVFAPGAGFQNYLDNNSIVFADPAPGEYTYAYQFTDISAAPAGISTFTVGLQGDEALGASGVTFVPAAAFPPTPPSNDPLSTGGGPGVSTSSQWTYFGFLGVGGTSGVLFYSSPQAPEFGFAVIASGTTFDTDPLSLPNPSTIPEPTSAMLFACGAVLLAQARGRYVRA